MNTRYLASLILLGVTACAASPQEPSTPAAPASERPAPTIIDAEPAPPVAAEPTAPTTAAPSQLRWRVEVSPATMSMAGRAKCRVRLMVTNDGAQPTAPPAHQGHFLVDGQPAMGADLSFSNGAMDQNWVSLPPGQTATTERELCEQLFPAPGEYTVGFRIGNDEAKAVAKVTR